MIFVILLLLVFLAVLLYVFVFKKRQTSTSNVFMKMVCSGTPKLPPLTEQQKHDILRRDFSPSVAKTQWDVIIIGSGLCGLSTAKILAASGLKVLVLEQHDRAGGACHTFELDKYEFDVGVHYVQDMYPGSDLHNLCLAITDSQLQWRQMDDPFDSVLLGDKRYGRKAGGRDVFQKQLHEWFPKEKENIDKLFKYTNACLAEIPWLFRAKFLPLFLVRILVKSGIFSLLSKVFKHTGRRLLEVMNEYNCSPDLQIVLSYYFANYGIPPNRSSFLQHFLFFMPNGYYPIGGATNITANIVHSIENLGGKVLVKADVKKISFENGKVNGVFVDRGRQECFIPARAVISTAPLTHTFKDLIPKEIGKKSAMSRVVEKVNELDAVHMATFQAYIGLNGSQEDLKLPSNNYIWFKSNDVLEVDNYLNLSVDEAIDYGCPPIVFICFPSGKDPIWNERHPGVSTCQLISIASPKWFEEYKDQSKKSQKRIPKEKYIRLKETMGDALMECLIKTFPDVSSKIAFTEFSTPLSQQFFMQNNYGELYSLSQQIERFLPDIWAELRCESGIPGLYFSGQDVLFCGIGSAFHNGLYTAGIFLQRDLQKSLNEAVEAQRGLETKKRN